MVRQCKVLLGSSIAAAVGSVSVVVGVGGAIAPAVANRAAPTPAVMTTAASRTETAVPTVTATLVSTVATSQLTPPLPDPAGITYLAARDHFLLSDSEVDETPVFDGANIVETARTGTVVDRGVTTSYTREAAGIANDPTNGHVFISDDDQFRVHEIAPGPDARYGTSDDTRTSFSTAAFGSTDPEDVTYFPPTGELFVLDGADNDVHRVVPGPNGRFDGVAPTGDDQATELDIQRYGAEDPEGITFHPGRGTLMVVDSTSHTVYELNREMMLVSRTDITASHQVFAAGIAVAPATDDASRSDLYLVDRGVDNDVDPAENDGKLYELRVDLPPIVNLAPVVDAGRDAPVTAGASLALRATVRDDGLQTSAPTVAWSRASGPGTATFSDPTAVATTVTFSAPGAYVVRATASDGSLSSTDDVTVTVVSPGVGLPLDTPVAKAFDDVEERPTGFADWLGATLNIPRAGTTAQTIGVRFDDLAVPVGATVTEAWVDFAASGSNSGATAIDIAGVAADDTPTFTTSSTTVSSRARTQTRVAWTPPAWSSGQRGAAQRTPDLRAVVQEVVGRAGWRSGNALALVLTGTGERRASSHDGATPPVLHVAYTAASAPTTPPVAAFDARCTGLTCTVDGRGSSDAEGPVASWHWAFSDGGTATGAVADHTFATVGTYPVTLTVTDGSGLTASISRSVTVTTGPAIGFRAVARTAVNATSATVTVPSGVRAGDVLLMFATVNVVGAAVTPPAGWTGAVDVVAGSQRTLMWHRVAVAADAGRTLVVALGSQAKVVLQLVAYTGTSPTEPASPVVVGVDPVATSAHPTPRATISGDGRWVVSYWADKSSTTTDWAPPSGVASRDDYVGTGGGHIGALLADSGGPVAAGTSAALTAITDSSTRASVITVVLQPG